jgi:hypothetical protein
MKLKNRDYWRHRCLAQDNFGETVLVSRLALSPIHICPMKFRLAGIAAAREELSRLPCIGRHMAASQKPRSIRGHAESFVKTG